MSSTQHRSTASRTAIGPYRILRILGHGGMGVVYHGEHVRTGEPAAVKTVFAVDEISLGAIRREIHALQRIHHLGIVRILEQGVDDRMPWYAMELLRGRTLRDLLREAWAQASSARPSDLEVEPTVSPESHDRSGGAPPAPPLPRAPELQPALSLIRRLCKPLSFLHGSGLVHRDIKPENVFIRPDGMPVLVDFGLAAQFAGAEGRERLELPEPAGTAPYMAPEQARGELVDARADLYALGCVLHECATGSSPIDTPATDAARRARSEEPPEPPSKRSPGIPAALDALILRLLEKRPADRLGYAIDVAATLGELGAEDWDAPGLPEARLYLYRPAFSGRVEILGQIREKLARAAAGEGGCVLLGGESGLGKTRLAMEVAAVARRERFLVMTGECAAVAAAFAEAGEKGAVRVGPLHPFRPLLLAAADRCRERGASEAERLFGGGAGKVLALYEPSLLHVPRVAAQPEPPALPPDAARRRIFDALERVLAGLAENGPLLLVLDDLQWADELSLGLLRELADRPDAQHGLAFRRALILGTYRVEEATTELAELARAPGVQSLSLDRLDTDGVGAMVAGMLALVEPPRALVEFLASSADGNPFFVTEYLQAAIAEGLLTRDPSGQWRLHEPALGEVTLNDVVPLPRALAELIDRRLGQLGEGGRRLLEHASILGRELDADLLEAIAGFDEADLLSCLDTLRERQAIEEAGRGRLRFVHDKIREIAYARIPAERRRGLHRRAAGVIEARRPGVPEHEAELAHHWAEAEVHDRASVHFARAADRARAAHANGQAIAFYRRALAEAALARAAGAEGAGVPLDPEERLQESLGELLATTGKQDEARAAFEAALGRMAEGDRLGRARLHHQIGKTWEIHHHPDEALASYALAEEALGPAPAEGSAEAEAWWHAWFLVQMDRTWVYYWLARVEDLAAAIDEVRPLLERRGAPLDRAQFFQALMHMDLRRDRYVAGDETVSYAYSSLRACEEAGDASELAAARFALGFTLLFHGDLDRAEAELTAALGDAERIGDVPLQARCLAYLMMTHRRRRAVGPTRAFAERTLAVANAGRMKEYLGAVEANLGWVALCEGDEASAEAHLQAALADWRPLAAVYPFQWMALLPLLAVELGRGRAVAAALLLRAALDPKQQRLPEELAAAPLERVAATARELGYL